MDPFKVLNIDSTASTDEIKKAYKKLALQHHPDKGGVEEKFKQITEAYNRLMNKKQKPKGAPHIITHSTSLEQYCRQETISVPYIRKSVCRCVIVCENCQGSGMMTNQMHIFIFQTPCFHCQGVGIKQTCSNCNQGYIEETCHQDVKLTDFEYTFPDQGSETYANCHADLIIRISLQKHAVFTVKNSDLYCDAHITLAQALCNHKLSIEHPSGETVVHVNKKIIKPSDSICIKNKGLPNGHMYINYHVNFPDELTDEQKIKLNEILK